MLPSWKLRDQVKELQERNQSLETLMGLNKFESFAHFRITTKCAVKIYTDGAVTKRGIDKMIRQLKLLKSCMPDDVIPTEKHAGSIPAECAARIE